MSFMELIERNALLDEAWHWLSTRHSDGLRRFSTVYGHGVLSSDFRIVVEERVDTESVSVQHHDREYLLAMLDAGRACLPEGLQVFFGDQKSWRGDRGMWAHLHQLVVKPLPDLFAVVERAETCGPRGGPTNGEIVAALRGMHERWGLEIVGAMAKVVWVRVEPERFDVGLVGELCSLCPGKMRGLEVGDVVGLGWG